jgi:hypothetical protein
MAYPKRQVTGSVYTCAGDVITSGEITAWTVPQGATVLDTNGTDRHKVGSRTQGNITASGITSFYLTAMESMLPSDAYYKVKFDAFEPYAECWYELWRITDAGGGNIAISEIPPLNYGPYLPKDGYAPVLFATGVGDQGPAGPAGTAKPTIVNSLPTVITSSMTGNYYFHNRQPKSKGDVLYFIGRTSATTLAVIKLMELP